MAGDPHQQQVLRYDSSVIHGGLVEGGVMGGETYVALRAGPKMSPHKFLDGNLIRRVSWSLPLSWLLLWPVGL